MPARLYVEQPLQADTLITLPPGPARHVQVLRLQPGTEITLFNGQGGEWRATVQHMGRSEVQVQVHQHDPVERELPHAITLAVGMPANERMDALVEKATELGVSAIQPLLTERSVLRLSGERAERRLAHWQGVAVAACEQSGRTRVPALSPVRTLAEWLRDRTASNGERCCVLSPRATQTLSPLTGPAVFLSGPEGGLTDSEVALAGQCAGTGASSNSARTRGCPAMR